MLFRYAGVVLAKGEREPCPVYEEAQQNLRVFEFLYDFLNFDESIIFKDCFDKKRIYAAEGIYIFKQTEKKPSNFLNHMQSNTKITYRVVRL